MIQSPSSSCNDKDRSFIKKTMRKLKLKRNHASLNHKNKEIDEEGSLGDSKLTINTVEEREEIIRINRNNNVVRFNMNLEIFEANTPTTTIDDKNSNTILWYSRNEIKFMKSKMSIFVEHMRKNQICHHYDNVTLEKMLENHSHNTYTIQGIEGMIDDDIQCQRIETIQQGIKAVLKEQQKSNHKQRIRIVRRQNKYNSSDEERINAIANCYIKSGNTIQCQREAHSRGIEYHNNLMIVSPTTTLVPPEVVRTKMIEI